MILKSKLNTFVSQYIGSLRTKSLFLQKNFPNLLALLLFGFLLGNVFGTFLNTLRFFFIWDVFIIFILIYFLIKLKIIGLFKLIKLIIIYKTKILYFII